MAASSSLHEWEREEHEWEEDWPSWNDDLDEEAAAQATSPDEAGELFANQLLDRRTKGSLSAKSVFWPTGRVWQGPEASARSLHSLQRLGRATSSDTSWFCFLVRI